MFAEYRFKNKAFYDLARTHTSYANEHRNSGIASNQRLEFLGDSVLGLIVSEYIYKNCPGLREGDLSKIRADVVCEDSLYEVAKVLGLGEVLKLGKGEDNEIGRNRPSTLADAVESMVAAVYLDAGLDTVREVLLPVIEEKIKDSVLNHDSKDYKTSLQEFVQKTSKEAVRYRTVGETGPDHNKTYAVKVFVGEKVMGDGSGRSKKHAEQNAAKMAMAKLTESAEK